MKKIKYLILILLIPSFISCEDYLDKQPTDQLSPASFWNTEQDATMALAGVYRLAHFQGIGANRRLNHGARVTGIGHWDALSDNAYANDNHANIRNIASGIHNSNTGGFASAIYYGAYQAIAACNNFLANIDNVEGADPDLITRYKAEVQFLRAFMYYWLTQVYGDVPLVTSPLTFDNMNLPRTPKANVLSFMYDDLDYAMTNLPDISYNGHVVKAAAMALKARVKLFNEEYQEAASLSKQVIDGNKFSLAEEYRSNFCEDFNQKNCPEIIFSFRNLGNSGTSLENGADVVYGWWCSIAPLNEFLNYHEPGDMRRVWNGAGVGDFWPVGNNHLGWDTIPKSFWVTTKTTALKWVNPTSRSSNWWLRGNDVTHIRLAEVLLVYAEARNESSGPDASVYDAVNRVRQRADLNNLPEGLSQAEMRERIRYERRVELFFEAQRYFDLIRWDIAKDVIPKINNPPNQTVTKRIWEDRFKLWPIPQAEIDKDPENMTQNPGW